MKTKAFFMLLAVSFSSHCFAQNSSFLQGPERFQIEHGISGTVLTQRTIDGKRCYGFLADHPAYYPGMGGGGRFFVCGEKRALQIGERVRYSKAMQQTGTTRMKVGPRLRVYPVFQIW